MSACSIAQILLLPSKRIPLSTITLAIFFIVVVVINDVIIVVILVTVTAVLVISVMEADTVLDKELVFLFVLL